MLKNLKNFETTKLGPKGQVVIPHKVRDRLGLKAGSVFAVCTQDHLIVMKKIEPKITAEELEDLKSFKHAWKEIEAGKGVRKTKEKFLKELKEW